MADRGKIAAAVYALITTRWPARFDGLQLADEVSLGSEGLGLDSIEIVELLLDCEDQVGGEADPAVMLTNGPISIGRLIDHLAQR